ncbi:MAG TPA: ABC transporter permease [Saprospiraceae bacterium]|nr:ABC transporter permease [Saprospiraceae bacterium]HMQ84154.1 ABC transporter permease [Saprospiraceae bacterium]
MNYHDLKTTFRNLQKRKGYTLLNILGLALGMTGCLLILQYVNHERSYDNFHPNGENIYRLRLDAWQDGQLSWQSATVFPAYGPTMKRDFPEVEEACRLHDAIFVMSNPKTNVKFSEKKGYYADPSFLKMFHLEFLAGDQLSALTEPDKIILSESMAKKYFGHTNVVGEQLVVKDPNLIQTYEVTGVFKDYPKNSHLDIHYLVSYATLQKYINVAWGDTENSTETSWGWYDFYTYLQLKPHTDVEKLRSKFPAFNDKYTNAIYTERNINLRNVTDIIALNDIHLHSNVNQEAEINGSGKAVSVLFLVALFILGIAWINYINLSTARSVERSREVGVRKVMGAKRWELIQQFLTESFLLNLTAFLISLTTAYLLMPLFSRFTGKTIPFDFLNSPIFWAGAGLVLLFGTLFSGLYPAFVLSAFQPVLVLKGALKNSAKGVLLRKGLTIFQFATSIALIAGTIIVYKQIKYMRSQSIGVNIAKTLVVEGAQTTLDSLYKNSFEPFKNEVLKLPQVANITASSSVPGDEIYWTNGNRPLSKGPEAPYFTLFNIGVDQNFMASYDLKIVAGRPFRQDSGADNEGETILLNESAVAIMGFDSPEAAVDQLIVRGSSDTLLIAGVTADFHHQGLQKAINPIAFRYTPDTRNYYSFKLKGEDPQQALAAIESKWSNYFPNDPFNYFFLDEFYNQQYQSDIQFGRVFSLFSLMSIFVACLGLLGLASYQILQRTKEIGIRKVLGASTVSIVGLLSKDFLFLVLLALGIATPVAYYSMNRWLQDFAYRIDLQWYIFALAGFMAIGIAFFAVSVQSVKAALANPVKSLRSE